MSVYELIKKKRNGHELSDTEIKFLIDGFVNGNIPDYQMAAFLMAVFFKEAIHGHFSKRKKRMKIDTGNMYRSYIRQVTKFSKKYRRPTKYI